MGVLGLYSSISLEVYSNILDNKNLNYIKMAKKEIKIAKSVIEGVMANQEFNALLTQNQVGDRFFIPEEDMLLVIGQAINALDRDGNELKNADGTPQLRQVGQRFCAVRLVDGQPSEVVELYVGQLVKVDAHRKIVFPNALSNALRQGDKAFKAAICGKTLEITEETMCDDRVWDQKANRWLRDAEDPNKLASAPKRALRFEPKNTALRADDIVKCNDMLYEYYQERYAEFLA